MQSQPTCDELYKVNDAIKVVVFNVCDGFMYSAFIKPQQPVLHLVDFQEDKL